MGPASSLSTTGGPSFTIGTAFDGLRNPFGTPPDTQVAVGPNDVIEMVNNSANVWTKDGTLISSTDLRSLFLVPFFNDGESDPRVVYDAQSGRFFAVYISYQTLFGNSTSIQIAWSTNSDPLGWTGCEFDDNSGHLHDNPAIGVSDDKVAIGTDVFRWPAAPSDQPVGADTLILDKSAMLTAGNCPYAYFGATSAGIIRPAQSLSATSALYMASLPETGGAMATIWTVTGNPSARNIVRTRTDLAIAGVTMPPDAVQPGAAITTNDSRALEAVWKSGLLDVAANTACVPAGDSVMRACLHLLQLSTSTPSVMHEVDIGVAGAYLYYPAVRPDASNDLVVVYTSSSATTDPSVGVTALDPAWAAQSSVVAKGGGGAYVGFDPTPYRWGDYSGAALDPADGNGIWVGGEYSASSSTGD